MPEYLAPGVFVEETSFRQKSIEGVGTSVAALVGPTRTGPLRGVPEVVTSYAEFERIYGDAEDLSFVGTPDPVPNHSAHAARAFFDNGGKQLFVSRIIEGVNATDVDGKGTTIGFGKAKDTNSHVTFEARFPGAQGNYVLELKWRQSENLLKSASPLVADTDVIYLLEASHVPEIAVTTGTLEAAKYPVQLKALVKKDGAELAVQEDRAEIASLAALNTPLAAAGIKKLDPTKLAGTQRLTRIHARKPTGGVLGTGTAAVLSLTAETNISAFTKGAHWGNLRTLRGTLDAEGVNFTVTADAILNPGVAASLTFPLSALAARAGSLQAVVALRTFDVEVRKAAQGEVLYVYPGLSTSTSGATCLEVGMPKHPAKKQEALTSPVWCNLAAGADSGDKILKALLSMCDPAALAGSDLEDPRYLIRLAAGNDGPEPTSSDFAGEVDEVHGSTGLASLEFVEDISIVMTPAAAATPLIKHQAVILEVQKHCRRMRYRVGIVDARKDMSLGEVRDFRSEFDDSRLALYHPWVVAADPNGGDPIALPPSGFIAGVYARTDVERGVHKAPANEVVMGALGFQQNVNSFQQELLNPNGINCLRSFPGRGHRVWGGRTLSSDPEWKYVNVRRYFLFLERSIDKSTQWAVFEPNGEALWANIRAAVEDFLYSEWKNGRLLGPTPKAAYFVRCDRSTMTQNDIDNGRMVCVVGVAALKPAEFVIFRIGQKTADA